MNTPKKYKCAVCKKMLGASKFDLYNDCDDEIQEFLLGNCYVYGLYPYEAEIPTIEKKIPLTVACPNSECEPKIKVIAEVKAAPEWSGDSLDADYFLIHDAKIIKFCYNEVKLRIICKTRMSSAYCYIGHDEDNNLLLRPNPGIATFQFGWPASMYTFNVGEVYKFRAIASGDIDEECPHKNEDIAVQEDQITALGKHCSWSSSSLEGIAHSSIFDIFPEEFICDDRYVDAGTDCPSAGVLSLWEDDIDVYEHFGKDKVTIRNSGSVFNLPLTATSFNRPVSGSVRNALVLLGLGRPYSGDMDIYNPARCYILVLAIYLYH